MWGEGWGPFFGRYGSHIGQYVVCFGLSRPNGDNGIWCAGLGLARIWWESKREGKAWFATVFLIFSFLAVCPGFYFRNHYFVLLLPAIALLAGAAIREPMTVGILAVALISSVFTQRAFLFKMTPLEAGRELYGSNPFPKAIRVADYIRAHSERNARIAVIGSEPEIYFYADRHSATSYIYMYSLMEPQPYALTMQEDMIREVTAAAPEFVVEVGGNNSWLRRATSPTRVFEWWPGYRAQHYREVGIADITDDGTEYRWNAAAENYQPQSDSWLAVYQRK